MSRFVSPLTRRLSLAALFAVFGFTASAARATPVDVVFTPLEGMERYDEGIYIASNNIYAVRRMEGTLDAFAIACGQQGGTHFPTTDGQRGACLVERTTEQGMLWRLDGARPIPGTRELVVVSLATSPGEGRGVQMATIVRGLLERCVRITPAHAASGALRFEPPAPDCPSAPSPVDERSVATPAPVIDDEEDDALSMR